MCDDAVRIEPLLLEDGTVNPGAVGLIESIPLGKAFRQVQFLTSYGEPLDSEVFCNWFTIVEYLRELHATAAVKSRFGPLVSPYRPPLSILSFEHIGRVELADRANELAICLVADQYNLCWG